MPLLLARILNRAASRYYLIDRTDDRDAKEVARITG